MTTHGISTLLARTARGAGWVMAWRLGMRALGLISTLILVRLLAPADFGLIALATGFMQTIDGMMLLGVEEAVIRAHAPDRDTYNTAFTLNVLRGAMATAIVAACAFPAGWFFGEPRLPPILLFVAVLPLLDGVGNIGAVDFRRDMAFHKEFAMMVLPKLGGILAAITAAILLRSYAAMLFGIGVNRVLRTVMSYRMHPFRPRLSLRAWRSLASYSIWSWLLSLAILLRDRADTLILGRLLGAGPLGVWSVGTEVAALPTTEIVEPLGRAAFSGFAEARRAGLAAGEVFARVLGAAALATIPAGVGLSLVAGPLVRVAFGPGWEDAVPVLRVVAIAGTVMALGHVSQHLLSVHGMLRRLSGLTLLGAVLRAVLLLILIPMLGLSGAAWAIGIAILIEQSLVVLTAAGRFNVRPVALLSVIWRPVVAAAAMAAYLAWLGLGWSPDVADWTLGSLVAGIAAGALFYPPVVLGLWGLAGLPDGVERDALRWGIGRLRRL